MSLGVGVPAVDQDITIEFAAQWDIEEHFSCLLLPPKFPHPMCVCFAWLPKGASPHPPPPWPLLSQA